MKQIKNFIVVSLAGLTALAFASCERERRQFREVPPGSSPSAQVRQSELQPGPPQPPVEVKNPDEENAYALSEGKRLFDAYNCAGCHAQGGAASGRP